MTVHHERRVKRERNQQDATNPMFVIKLLSQHVSDIIMPIIRTTVQNTICGSAHSCSPDDGHNDARNMFEIEV